MAFTKITYRAMVGPDTPTEYPQTADQAALSIGINYVVGFRIEREETTTKDGQVLTVVSVYGSHDVLFGQYEFHGRM